MSDHSETKDTRMNAEEETKSCEEPTDSKEETKELPFSVKTWTEDLKLIVEGKSIYVNKATLALLSPVFEKMFNANFRERDCEELELPDKEYDSFIEFLDCVYPGHHTCHKEVTGMFFVCCVCLILGVSTNTNVWKNKKYRTILTTVSNIFHGHSASHFLAHLSL